MAYSDTFITAAWPVLINQFGASSAWTYRSFAADGTSTDTAISELMVRESVPDSPDARREGYQLRVLVKTSDLPAAGAERGSLMIDPDTSDEYAVDDYEVLLKSGLTRMFLVKAQERD